MDPVKKKWWIIGGVLAALVIITTLTLAIVYGVKFSKCKRNNLNLENKTANNLPGLTNTHDSQKICKNNGEIVDCSQPHNQTIYESKSNSSARICWENGVQVDCDTNQPLPQQ